MSQAFAVEIVKKIVKSMASSKEGPSLVLFLLNHTTVMSDSWETTFGQPKSSGKL